MINKVEMLALLPVLLDTTRLKLGSLNSHQHVIRIVILTIERIPVIRQCITQCCWNCYTEFLFFYTGVYITVFYQPVLVLPVHTDDFRMEKGIQNPVNLTNAQCVVPVFNCQILMNDCVSVNYICLYCMMHAEQSIISL